MSKMIKITNLDFTNLYENMYLKSLKEVRFQSYVISNINVTDNGLGYIMFSQELLDKLEIDVATATSAVNALNYINEIYVWVIFAYDKVNDNVRVSIRSRGPIINEIATHYNGGGHMYASGARIKDFDVANDFIKELDEVCFNYRNN